MSNNVPDVHRRVLSDYRIALGLELRTRRTNAEYSFEKLASLSSIPAETLRSYEKGASLPQLARLVDIGNVYDVTLFDILESAAEYIYRASGEPAPNHTTAPAGKITLRAVVLYCGVTPAQLQTMETHPRRAGMSEHPASMPGEREAHPVRTAPRWGMSPLDCKAHAIDEDAEHPYGVFVARCGHRLLMGTNLHGESPDWMCLSCLRWNEQPHPRREEDGEERVATRVTDPPAPVQVSVQGTRTHPATDAR